MAIKYAFLLELMKKGRIYKCYELGYQFHYAKNSVYDIYKYLSDECEKKYAPLQLLFGYFILNCCQDRDLANKLLNSYSKASLKNNYNLNLIFSDKRMRDKDFTVIYISAEENNYHKIVYSSSNLFKWVGYKNKELQGADLDILLPPAIRRIHKTIINEEFISGTMLMNNRFRRLACQTKQGYLVPFSFGVRINNQLFSGMQYVGVLNFKLRARDCCVLLTNKKGEIQGLTESAQQFF